MKYQIDLTDNQLSVVRIALEEYFQPWLKKSGYLCDDFPWFGYAPSPDNPREDHPGVVKGAFYRELHTPAVPAAEKTQNALIMADIWAAILYVQGSSRCIVSSGVSSEPVPVIREVEE